MGRRRRYKYLYRLIAISLLLLSIPICLFITYFVRKSFNQVQKGNDAYYEKVTESFISQFSRDIEEMKKHAANLSVRSKNPGSALYTGVEAFVRDEQWYYEVIQDFYEINDDFRIGECSVYYYDLDSVITTGSRMTAEQYVYDYLKITDDPMFFDFFDAENYLENKIQFVGNAGKEADEGILLVGICTRFGGNRDKVSVFYKLTPEAIMALMGKGYEDGVNFYILDSNTDNLLLALEEKSDREGSIPKIGTELRNNLTFTIAHERKSAEYPLTYITAISDESRQGSVETFYKSMRWMIFGFVIFMLFLCLTALYLEYKPMYRLINEIEKEKNGEDEFSIIRNTLEERRTRIEEQEIMIKDLLVNHLIYGTQISVFKLERLGVDVKVPHYCVYLLENKVLLTSEANNLSESIEKRHLGKLYIADLQEEEQSVIIGFLNGNVERTEKEIRSWLYQYLGTDIVMRTGKTVDKLEEIRISFRSCLKQKETGKSGQKDISIVEEKGNKLKLLEEKVRAYLDIHYKDINLSRTQVADDLHISSYALNNVFKTQIGMGFTEFVNAKRLMHAKELLMTTDMPAQDIASAVGFENKNYFYRLFKATTDMSVTEFREQ